MNILLWVIFGALAGWIASIIMKTNAEQGALGNIIVGILGAFLGGVILSIFTGSDGITGFNISSLLTAILGAVLLLAIVKSIRGHGRTTDHRI
jgi:uncharacterized membrane protein YeaQ/YmgE (transglycosylase-associated protein family)